MVNHKRVYRVYQAAGRAVPRRKRKRVAVSRGEQLQIGTRPNEHWSLDFMSATLCPKSARGRRLRTLAVLDPVPGTRWQTHSVGAPVDTYLPSRAVTRVLDRILLSRPGPERITLDNGPELTSIRFDQWTDRNGIELGYIDPGKTGAECWVPTCG